MANDRLKRVTRPLWAPLVRRLDEIVARLDQLDHAVGRLTDETIGLPDLRKDLVALREDVWHAKAVNLGDRLLVGCRHLGLVFIVDPDDRLIGPRFIVDGEYEPETTAFVRRTVTETSVCIDVGANFGYYTCLFGHLAWRGHTLSYEADPQVHRLLRDNVNINLLNYLVINRNKVLTRQQLYEHIWGNILEDQYDSNFIDVHIKNVRRKLNEFATTSWLETVRGIGYRVSL